MRALLGLKTNQNQQFIDEVNNDGRHKLFNCERQCDPATGV
jgi:hypothetical protein